MSFTKVQRKQADKLFSKGLKKCSKCGKIKNLNKFFKSQKTRYGVVCRCKDCLSKTKVSTIKKRKQVDDLFKKNLRICSRCHVEKKLEDFPVSSNNKSSRDCACKSCLSKAYFLKRSKDGNYNKYKEKIKLVKQLFKQGLKQCNKCKVIKGLEKFNVDKHSNTGRRGTCKVCSSKTGRKRLELFEENKKLFINGIKKCTECGQVKSLDAYMKDRSREDGYFCRCKLCIKKYRDKSLVSETTKKYRKLNCTSKDYIDKINCKDPYYEAKFDQGKVLVKCRYCTNYFSPINLDVQNFTASKNKGGYRDLYCSEQCKVACSTRGQQQYPKGFKKIVPVRWGHTVWANFVKKRDNYVCKKCGEVHSTMYAHHIIPYLVCKFVYLDPPNGITLCNKCHWKVHEKEGCTLKDLIVYKAMFERLNGELKNVDKKRN